MKMIRLTLGLCLLATPFAVFTGVMVVSAGWALAIVTWAIVVAICLCIIGGIYLLNKSEGVY